MGLGVVVNAVDRVLRWCVDVDLDRSVVLGAVFRISSGELGRADPVALEGDLPVDLHLRGELVAVVLGRRAEACEAEFHIVVFSQSCRRGQIDGALLHGGSRATDVVSDGMKVTSGVSISTVNGAPVLTTLTIVVSTDGCRSARIVVIGDCGGDGVGGHETSDKVAHFLFRD